MKHATIIFALLLAGCNMATNNATGEKVISSEEIDKEGWASPDQCLRAKLFDSCLKALPAGPVATKYNDWDDVVSECEASAKKLSLRILRNIPKECRYE